ncbi:YbjN domain-containing protein [Alteriqipengyuania sp. WL0013]|uniref:YbjN domain-containing protein n=1 Tax=Alteriqipengyuania sp. WL0013 TaxID=3110773 RepID=UPI002BB34603|nr:YbjN domain-containing protein [Alteriqipengyuania sp. WL0013]MEB3415787.1 YbjN domain-containing protein [Alteriqipengyuania sp. WL0013]
MIDRQQRQATTVDQSPPVDMLAQLFEARGWPCEFVEENEITGEVQGSWANYQLRAIWRQEDHVLQLLCLPDIRATEGRRANLHELISLINEQVWLGHFETWSKGGMILYRNAMMLGDDGMLDLSQAQALVENAVAECDRFYPAFQFSLWGEKSPREALDSALIDPAGEA